MIRLFAVGLAALAAAPATGTSYVSTRYAYSLLLPVGWSADAAPGAWSGALNAGVAGVDTFRDAEDGSHLLAAAAMPTGERRDVWHAHALRGARLSCAGRVVGGTRLLRFGGANATLTSYHCGDGSYLSVVTLVHASRGYAFAWKSHAPRALADRDFLEGILDSLDFPG